MKIAIGSDHRGYPLKQRLVETLGAAGHEMIDVGTDGTRPADYPVYAVAVGEKVASGEAERGIVVCGSGIGVSSAANKVRGVRAALCRTVEDAVMTRRHNDSNVLALSEAQMDDPAVGELVDTWLDTPFEGGRHARRVKLIADYEKRGGE